MRRFRRHPDAVWREEAGPREAAERHSRSERTRGGDVATSILLLHGDMLSLNLLGTEVWARCDGRTLDELVAAITEVFDVAPGEARTDVADLLAALERHGFLDDV